MNERISSREHVPRKSFLEMMPIQDQIEKLKILYPGLKTYNEAYLTRTPSPGHQLLAVPNCSKFSRTNGISYDDAVRDALGKLGARGLPSGDDPFDDESIELLLMQLPEARILTAVGAQQGDPDILIVEAQFGTLFTEKTPSEVLASLSENQYVLGSFEIAVILLLHRDQLNFGDKTEVTIGSVGERMSPDPDHAPAFTVTNTPNGVEIIFVFVDATAANDVNPTGVLSIARTA